MLRAVAIFLILVVPSSTIAGVPQIIHPTTGEAIGWKDATKIPAMFDRGSLGRLTNAQARALVESMMSVWEEVESSNVAFDIQGALATDVTVENIGEYIDGTVCADEYPAVIPSMRVGESPIIFDTDGSIIDHLAGKGASQKIVGKSAFRCYEGSLDNPSAATQAFIIFNGLFVDGESGPSDLSINAYAGIMLHELGHFLGLHHSMVNSTVFSELLAEQRAIQDSRYLPVMYPLVLRGSVASTVLHPDDIAIISALHPAAGHVHSRASLRGTIWSKNDTGFRGANVVARRQDDPLCQAVATVSGRYCTPLLDSFGQTSLLGEQCHTLGAVQGGYRIEGLTPGAYTVAVSELSNDSGARKNMFPKNSRGEFPGVAEYYNTNDVASDSAADQTILQVSAGDELVELDIMLAGNETAGGKAVDISTMSAVSDSACITDPVDYNELMASVANDPNANLTGTADESLKEGDSANAGAGGCGLAKGRPASSQSLPIIVFMIGFGVVGYAVRRRSSLAVALVVVPMLLPTFAVEAGTVLPATPNELTSMAGTIFHGTCEKVRTFYDARGLHVHDVTYRVHATIKGTPVERTTFRVVTGMVAATGSEDAHHANHGPFVVGQEDILFLYPTSDWGYTSPVAGGQGTFHVYQGTNGLTIVRNPFAPTNTNQGKASSQGSPADSALTVDAFLDQVNTIIQQQAP